MIYTCVNCLKPYVATHRGWYDDKVPHVCSATCFVALIVALSRLTEGAFATAYETGRITNFTDKSDRNFRSNYEREFKDWLLLQKELCWEYEPYSITLNDGTHYVPDFDVYPMANDIEGSVFIEVKGPWTSEGRRKFKAMAEQFNIPLLVVDKEFLTLLKKTR